MPITLLSTTEVVQRHQQLQTQYDFIQQEARVKKLTKPPSISTQKSAEADNENPTPVCNTLSVATMPKLPLRTEQLKKDKGNQSDNEDDDDIVVIEKNTMTDASTHAVLPPQSSFI